MLMIFVALIMKVKLEVIFHECSGKNCNRRNDSLIRQCFHRGAYKIQRKFRMKKIVRASIWYDFELHLSVNNFGKIGCRSSLACGGCRLPTWLIFGTFRSAGIDNFKNIAADVPLTTSLLIPNQRISSYTQRSMR